SNVRVRRNWIEVALAPTADLAAHVGTDGGKVRDVRIEENFLSGGNNTFVVHDRDGNGCPANVLVAGNRFGTVNKIGPFRWRSSGSPLNCKSATTLAGNVWHDNGEPVD